VPRVNKVGYLLGLLEKISSFICTNRNPENTYIGASKKNSAMRTPTAELP